MTNSDRVNLNIKVGKGVKFTECPPGLFLSANNVLCLMTEYYTDSGNREAYTDSGEFFWGGTTYIKDRDNLIVYPISVIGRELPQELPIIKHVQKCSYMNEETGMIKEYIGNNRPKHGKWKLIRTKIFKVEK